MAKRAGPIDPVTLRSEVLQLSVAELVDGEDGRIVATALTYVLAGIVAEAAPSLEVAESTIDAVAAVMKQQIRAFGVGRRHP